MKPALSCQRLINYVKVLIQRAIHTLKDEL